MFQNTKFATKIRGLVVIMAAITFCVGIFGLLRLGKVNDLAFESTDNYLPSIETLSKMRAAYQEIRTAHVYELLAGKDGADFQRAAALIEKNKQAFTEADAKYATLQDSDTERALSANFHNLYQEWMAVHDRIAGLIVAGKLNEANELNTSKARALGESVEAALGKSLAYNSENAARVGKDTHTIAESSRVWIIGIILAGVALGLLLGEVVGRGVVTPLKALVFAAEHVAEGDVNVTIDHTSGDELGQAASAQRRALEAQKGLLGEFRRVITATSDGHLEVRADAKPFKGIYAELLNGLNQTLENLAKPIQFLGSNTGALQSSAEQLTAVSTQMGQNARQTSEQAGVVSAASEEVSKTAQAVATAVEQMNKKKERRK